ncbi:MAG: hypothetical protein KDA68_03355 [Planctomycetaceae bacterium]|nr:hypothetical protein [Planctomycetaceae bacterium]
MKKRTSLLGLALAGLLGITGFSLAEVSEYFQVARNKVAASIRVGIPLDVEIDRMELLLKKTDEQVGHQKYQVAKTQIALEDAEAIVAREQGECESTVATLERLRNLQPGCNGKVQVGCSQVTADDVRRALSHKLSAYKMQTAALASRKEAVEKQRQAYQVLATNYQEWNRQRELLVHRLEALRAREAAQHSATGGSELDTSELARAGQLADQIEARLRVAEKQQVLGATPIDSLLSADGSEATQDLEAEVDAVLKKRL